MSCAAANAVVDSLRGVIPGVAKRSEHAFARWNDAKDRYRTIGHVRGLGLMIGIDLVTEGNTPDSDAFGPIADHAFESGMFILNCGPSDNVIRFIPPLNVSMVDLDRGIDILIEAIAAYEK